MLVPFICNAWRGAVMAAALEFELASNRKWHRAAWVFAIALWKEGWSTSVRINVWIVVLLMAFLVFAGSGIFIAAKFLTGYHDPGLTVVMFFGWLVLAVAGWLFTITTARVPAPMGVCAALLLVSFTALSITMDVAA